MERRKPIIFNYKKIKCKNDSLEILLIESDHPLYKFEVYWKQNGLFAGYTGNKLDRENNK